MIAAALSFANDRLNTWTLAAPCKQVDAAYKNFAFEVLNAADDGFIRAYLRYVAPASALRPQAAHHQCASGCKAPPNVPSRWDQPLHGELRMPACSIASSRSSPICRRLRLRAPYCYCRLPARCRRGYRPRSRAPSAVPGLRLNDIRCESFSSVPGEALKTPPRRLHGLGLGVQLAFDPRAMPHVTWLRSGISWS